MFVPGALFFLGDCHAVQGDGEIVGTGVETCCDVEVRLTVEKGRTIGWPRGETRDESSRSAMRARWIRPSSTRRPRWWPG